MSRGPGRDQREPMERLVRIAAVLRAKGAAGESGDRLAEIAGFTGKDKIDQLKRDIRHLAKQGWQIDNIAPAGESAHYRMTTVDNRLKVRLSDGQQSALRRAVLLADRADLAARLGLPADQAPREVDEIAAAVPVAGASDALSVVVRAVRTGALLRFSYKGTARVVHPESLRTQMGTWYLRGVEDGDATGTVKSFVVSRMSDLSVDKPRTARRPLPARHPGLHPMSWAIDPPVDVTLETTPGYAPDVRRSLGEPVSEERRGDVVEMTYRVTHRAALRARLYELGRRVRLVGPEAVRAELIAELTQRAGMGHEA